MWGTRIGRKVAGEINRFIPTHVGNTVALSPLTRSLAVHPHACGEHPAQAPVAEYWSGSSPRMWGTHKLVPDDLLVERFIPTHVGNTRL